MIPGLESIYQVDQPWCPLKHGRLFEDPWGGSAFLYHPCFEGAMEIRAAEALYYKILDLQPNLVVETGTCDGFSACFIARALEGVGKGVLWTCEIESVSHEKKSPRPWPKVWDSLGLAHRVKGFYGDSRSPTTWEELPGPVDVLLLDSDHDLSTILSEWDVLGHYLHPHGVLVLHDAELIGDVRAAVGMLFELGGFKTVEHLDSCRGLAVLAR